MTPISNMHSILLKLKMVKFQIRELCGQLEVSPGQIFMRMSQDLRCVQDQFVSIKFSCLIESDVPGLWHWHWVMSPCCDMRESWPIRGQDPGVVITLGQSEARRVMDGVRCRDRPVVTRVTLTMGLQGDQRGRPGPHTLSGPAMVRLTDQSETSIRVAWSLWTNQSRVTPQGSPHFVVVTIITPSRGCRQSWGHHHFRFTASQDSLEISTLRVDHNWGLDWRQLVCRVLATSCRGGYCPANARDK